jgi:chorismate lyase/3-hydroxybenzoate synthase
MNPTLPLSATVSTTAQMHPPAWVADIFRDSCQRSGDAMGAATVNVRESEEFSLVTIVLPGARQLGASAFEDRTADVYFAIERELRRTTACHPVRLWNHLPEIHAPSDGGIDRYMAFNAGRFRSYNQWLGGAGTFDRTVPSASAVGHRGEDLVIHALGARIPGIAVSNPRQIAPYRYSKRFGPRPPCFARATVLPAGKARPRRVLVGGTASIRGEDSLHLNDLQEQTRETFDNLAHLIRAAIAPPSDAVNGMSPADVHRWLNHFTNLRIYYVRDADRPFIESRASGAFAPTCQIEYVRADLCRAELLVEIEGVATE